MEQTRQKKLRSLVLCFLAAILFWNCEDENKEEPGPNIQGSAIQLEMNYLDFSADGGEEEIGLNAREDWEITNNAGTWLDVSPDGGAKGETLTLTIRTDSNEGSKAREGQVVVKALSGNAADTLTVRQAGRTRYVAVDWENEATLTQFDLQSGTVRIAFEDDVPTFTPEISSIVVPTDTMTYIRVVQSVSGDGKEVTLQTKEGYMTDIFMNQEFTLSLTPNPGTRMTRSGRLNTTDDQGVIHPDKIIARMKDGREITLYDATTKAAEDIPQNIPIHIWSGAIDYTDSTLFKSGDTRLYWEKCVLSAQLGGNFYFAFNSEEKPLPGGLPFKTGRLDNFYFFLDGSLSADLLLALESSIDINFENSNTLARDFIDLKVSYPVGGIPLVIFIKADMLIENAFNLEYRGKISTGFHAGIGLNAGVNYINDVASPIFEPYYSFNIYPPKLEITGDISASTTVYPYFKIRFYNFAGPNIAYKPYLAMEANVGAALSADLSQSYSGWSEGLFTQDLLTGNLSLEFIGKRFDTREIKKQGDKNYLFRAPTQIELLSPLENDQVFTPDEPIEVRFRINGEGIGDLRPITPGAIVRVTASGGKTDRTFYRANNDGDITVIYTPEEEGDYITASVLDEEGEAIDEVRFTPVLEKKKFNITGTWLSRSGLTIKDSDGSIMAEKHWYDILELNDNDGYFFEHNPGKEIVSVTHGNFTSVFQPYGYSRGIYKYNANPSLLTIDVGEVANLSTQNGEPDPGASFYSVFEKGGTYEVMLETDSEGNIDNSIFNIIDTDEQIGRFIIVFERASNSAKSTLRSSEQTEFPVTVVTLDKAGKIVGRTLEWRPVVPYRAK